MALGKVYALGCLAIVALLAAQVAEARPPVLPPAGSGTGDYQPGQGFNPKRNITINRGNGAVQVDVRSNNASEDWRVTHFFSINGFPQFGSRWFNHSGSSSQGMAYRVGLVSLVEVNEARGLFLRNSSNVISLRGPRSIWGAPNVTDLATNATQGSGIVAKNITVSGAFRGNCSVTLSAFIASANVTIPAPNNGTNATQGFVHPRGFKYSVAIDNFPWLYNDSSLVLVHALLAQGPPEMHTSGRHAGHDNTTSESSGSGAGAAPVFNNATYPRIGGGANGNGIAVARGHTGADAAAFRWSPRVEYTPLVSGSGTSGNSSVVVTVVNGTATGTPFVGGVALLNNTMVPLAAGDTGNPADDDQADIGVPHDAPAGAAPSQGVLVPMRFDKGAYARIFWDPEVAADDSVLSATADSTTTPPPSPSGAARALGNSGSSVQALAAAVLAVAGLALL